MVPSTAPRTRESRELEHTFYTSVVPQRPSQRPNNVAYYWRNREMEISRVRIRQAATLEMLRELRQVPCADCRVSFEPHQMDFDHRDPATKSFDLMTGRAMLMSTRRLMAEVEKCDIVCANCHRVRTQAAEIRRPRKARQTPSTERKLAVWRSQASLLTALRDVPCFDCARRFPSCAMDFDHRDAAMKTSSVTRMVGRASTSEILAEAEKCDIVCANCHRLRTYSRRTSPAFERE